MAAVWSRGAAFSHPVIGADGWLGYSLVGRAMHTPMPKVVRVRNAHSGGKPVVLRTFTRAGADADFVLGSTDFAKIASGRTQVQSISIEYARAGWMARVWYTPGIKLAAMTAVTAWAAAVAAAVFGYVRATSSQSPAAPQTPGNVAMLAAIAFALAAVSATIKFISELRAARK